MSDYLYCPTCETSQDRKFTNCLKCGGVMVEHADTLEAMSTEEFLGWLLNNCAMDEEEERKARLLVNTFFIVQTVKADWDIQAVAETYPNLNAWNLAAQVTP